MSSPVTVALDPQSIIIFNHIPKTGGTSIIHFFRDMFGEDKCYRHRARDSRTNTRTLAIESVAPEERTKLRFLAGHFDYGKHQLFDRSHAYLGFVRDPVDRFLSDYYFNRKTGTPELKKLTNELTPDEYLETKKKVKSTFLKNSQIVALTGQEDLEVGMAIIQREYLVAGTMDQLDRAQSMLASIFGRPDLAPKKVNVTKDGVKETENGLPLSPESVALIRERTAIDMAFIERLGEYFETRWSEQAPAVSA